MTHSRPGGRTVASAALVLASLALVAPANAATNHSGQRPLRHLSFSTRVAPATRHPDPSFGPSQRRAELQRQQRLAGTTADRLGLGPREALVVKDVMRDTDGTEHVRYNRTYAGLPVVGGDMVVQRATSGALQATRATNARITLTSTQARLAGGDAKARAATHNDLRAGSAAPVKVVFAARHRPVLAWQTTVIGTAKDGTPIRDLVYTDATTGKQLGRLPQIMDANGVGHSLYSGTVTVKTVHSGSKYQLIDNTRGGHRTYGKQHKCCTSRGVLFTDGNNIWGNGKTSSSQSAAVDAAYGAASTWDFYKDRFSRLGIRNNGRAAYSRVHFRRNYDNAFWDDSCFCMTYGDGGTIFKPLVALDVAGHEMSHGVTSATAGLDYVGDAGGLNESTSDVMGTMVEFSAHNRKDPGDYLLGEKIVKHGSFARRMDNPKADGNSRNCWSASVGSLDPHYSSGVGNHLFYLLSEGTGTKQIGGRQHSSTACNGTTLPGIGRTKATAIWYRALTAYWTSTTTYPQAANGQVQAAKDLYSDPQVCQAVVDAWRAVSVHTTEGCGAGASPSDNLIQNSGFESGPSGWATSSTPAGSAIIVNKNDVSPVPAHKGSWFAYLDDYGATHTIPSVRTSPSTAAPRRRL